MFTALLLALLCTATWARKTEIRQMPNRIHNDFVHPLPHTYVSSSSFPSSWDWSNVQGRSYMTKNLNQHIPQYCGSCWAHAALSALADRIKIARQGKGIDINFSIQYILNCGRDEAGSCSGGDSGALHQFVKKQGFVPYDTCLPYEACSADSEEQGCKGRDWECTALNTCKTCSTFTAYGGFCSALDIFPNATIAEYGQVAGEEQMMAEIYARGPISCYVNAAPIDRYNGGILDAPTADRSPNHAISVYGWGVDSVSGKKFWRIRNSWGEYYGEMGHVRLVRGENQLGIEDTCYWATPGTYTVVNFGCYEDGSNCVHHETYSDPAIAKAWHF